ncbi:hypothetical protein D3H65_11930 [Paraflavitalea soli]|uniref:Endonuclease/exonuclease/phosphatase domain-containing protein n=1 Tax=Paraflavitalea soli TaxID=2315862 RepID=A0A3B7MNU4_9BACT|nr:hypothetical protein [Paraflavitalea soli]AXY74646.1 hypothetical protein D3H65_11930 [Paraflavitalea soli]
MKIVSWNLKNIGQTKLSNAFAATYRAFGLGNNVLDFMMGLVMGRPRWNAVAGLTTNPADIFVVIELKTGGTGKGQGVSGTCLPTLQGIRSAMNTLVGQIYPNNNNPPYTYDYITPQIVGYHETVGILYNTKRLKVLSAQAFRDHASQKWINPRTPYGALFQVLNSTDSFQVVGIHAPPPKGANGVKYRPPIEYCVKLPGISPASMTNTFIMGDFNCNPASYYVKNIPGGTQNVFPFTGLPAYGTLVPNGTLSSVRTKPANTQPPPANYLSDAYDNIIYNAALPGAPQELVVDMIGKARDMNTFGYPLLVGTNLVALVNAYNKVSDHMPVVIEW